MAEITFDLEKTRRNLNGDVDLIRSVAEILIEDLPKVVANLRTAATVENEPGVRQAAHTIKGMAANFTAQPLMEFARQLECTSCGASSLDLKAAVDAIGTITERTIAALQQELGL